jgi:hypothetical protein
VPVLARSRRTLLASHAAPSATACFGVRVHRHRPAELGAHQLGDERRARRATDQQYGVQLLRRASGGPERALQRLDRVVQCGRDHGLELGPGQRDLGDHLGSSTGIDVSVSGNSGSLAWTHSSRMRANGNFRKTSPTALMISAGSFEAAPCRGAD